MGATTIVVASATSLVVGMTVEGAGIAAGTAITGISGTTITISLGTTAALSSTTVNFTQTLTQGVTGFYVVNQQADILLNGSMVVNIPAGTPQANLPVYIRALANANLPGTAVGDIEAADDVATTTPTTTDHRRQCHPDDFDRNRRRYRSACNGAGYSDEHLYHRRLRHILDDFQPATATTSTQAASFSNMILLGDSVNPWIRFRTGNPDQNDVFEVTVLVRHAA